MRAQRLKAPLRKFKMGGFDFPQSLEPLGFALCEGGFAENALRAFSAKPSNSRLCALLPYGVGGFSAKPPHLGARRPQAEGQP